MNYDWQNIAALICVAIATAYAVFWLYRSIRSKSAGCGSCSSKKVEQTPTRQIVPVDELAKSGEQRRKA